MYIIATNHAFQLCVSFISIFGICEVNILYVLVSLNHELLVSPRCPDDLYLSINFSIKTMFGVYGEIRMI